MPEEHSTRDRVRALVREVLEKAAPAEETEETSAAQTRATGGAQTGETQTRARVVNVATDTAATPEKEYARDESSKTVITETDVRGLPEGSGLRAAACYDTKVARNSREHNDANVLTLGSGTIDSKQMRDIVQVWLSTEISEERHKKRVAKIEAVERQYRS